jgi:hypothetical protein
MLDKREGKKIYEINLDKEEDFMNSLEKHWLGLYVCIHGQNAYSQSNQLIEYEILRGDDKLLSWP